MGPITLFDKSFLQSLTVDESVWFDHYFTPNLCPLFFVETLADLAKSNLREGRTAEHEVAIIAEKTPEVSSYACAYHGQLCLGDLLGHPVPLTGQIPMPGGQTVQLNGQTGLVFPQAPEIEAMSRWQAGQFQEVEHIVAREWRRSVSELDLKGMAETMQAIGINGKTCKSLDQAAKMARDIVQSSNKPFDQMKLLFYFTKIGRQHVPAVLERWKVANFRPLAQHAPYAAHILTIELFFQISLAASLISSDRPSNRVDISYLFYLPFCEVFTSTDRLHKKCAPLFLREDQDFIWGDDLKADLRHTNAHWLTTLTDAQREAGLNTVPHVPVELEGSVIVRLWDRHSPGWRNRLRRAGAKMSPEMEKQILERVNAIREARPVNISPDERLKTDFPHATVERSVHPRKGSWWQLPKGVPRQDD
jgi:hypothetical protein